jgi:hypothetical protein
MVAAALSGIVSRRVACSFERSCGSRLSRPRAGPHGSGLARKHLNRSASCSWMRRFNGRSRTQEGRPTVRPFEIASAPTVSAVPRPASFASGFASGHGRPPAKCSKGLGITDGERGIRSTHKELSLADGWPTQQTPSLPLAKRPGDPRSALQSPNEVGVARAQCLTPGRDMA